MTGRPAISQTDAASNTRTKNMQYATQTRESLLPASLATRAQERAIELVRRKALFVDHTAALGGGELAMLQIVTNLDKNRYQPVVVLFSEGKLALKLREAGIETHVMPLNSEVAETRKDSLGPLTLLKTKNIRDTVTFAFRLAQFIRAEKFDLVYTNSLKSDIIGGLAARLAGRPVIWHIRDRIEEDYLPAPVVRAFRALCRLVPDYVLANSNATLQTLKLPRQERTATVYSGVDTAQCVVPDAIRSDVPAPSASWAAPSAPRIGLVGRISRWKGQHIFLQAAAQVRKRYPDAQFQIVGSALFNEENYEKEVKEMARSLDLGDSVEFTGFRSDIPEVMAGLDILVHASITGEPFGQVVVQGMAAGKPVVATNGGGIPEIVADGLTGLLVPMADADAMAAAICHLISKPALAQQMGLMGRQRVLEQFTIDHTIFKVEQVFDSLFAPGRN